MPKSDLTLSSGDYATVAERIALFWERYPDGRIITDLVSHAGDRMIVKAAVYRSASEREPAATGWAAEREGDGEINSVACLENTETSAVGRALANLGFAASWRRPSLEEMVAANARRARLQQPRSASPAADALPRRTDEVMDFLDLLRSAERLGYSPRRADVLRRRALAGDVQSKRLARIARSVRLWMRRGAVRSLLGTYDPPSTG